MERIKQVPGSQGWALGMKKLPSVKSGGKKEPMPTWWVCNERKGSCWGVLSVVGARTRVGREGTWCPESGHPGSGSVYI